MTISKEEFAARMRAIANDSDTEAAHSKADRLLCEVLVSLGYEDGVEVFELMDRWYG